MAEPVRPFTLTSLLAILFLLANPSSVLAATQSKEAHETPLRLAVASNFAEPAREIAVAFTRSTNTAVSISTGSTGKLFAQILHGAPYDVFLSADAERPRLLEASGHTMKGSRITYALGRLAFWSEREARNEDDCRKHLEYPQGGVLAMANARLAPYGVAARQLLSRVGTEKGAGWKIVEGENIAQAWHFIASGAASAGLVAWPQLRQRQDHPPGGCSWLVPAEMHEPIIQQAVRLKRSPAAASAFLEFLRSKPIQSRLKALGYATDPDLP